MKDKTITERKPGWEKKLNTCSEGFHTAKKCDGCPYGFKKYCVGICWKDVYASVAGKRSRQRAE